MAGMGYARPGSDEWVAMEQARLRGSEGPNSQGGPPIGRPPRRDGNWFWDRKRQQWVSRAESEAEGRTMGTFTPDRAPQHRAPEWGPTMPGSGQENAAQDNTDQQAEEEARMTARVAAAIEALRRSTQTGAR